MAMVKVIYVDQRAGKVADSRLGDLIAKGEIAAFCGSDGWVEVKAEQASDSAVDHQKFKRKETRT